MLPDDLAAAQQFGQFQGPPGHAHQEQAGEQSQTAQPGDQQRLQRCGARRGAFVVESDQQIGAEAGQFPEHEQQDDVVSQHHAEHRAHEEQEIGVECAQLGVAFQVAAGVYHDEGADAADDEREHRRQSIGAQGDVHVDQRCPIVRDSREVPVSDFRDHQCEIGCDRGDECAQHPMRGAAQRPMQRGSECGESEYQEDAREHGLIRLSEQSPGAPSRSGTTWQRLSVQAGAAPPTVQAS